jgi:NAD(P)-dependent dehydrogenase (short-subunit alcohol dehydrogenase family)
VSFALQTIIMNNKVWLITGAGRGMGVDIAKAALKAGHKVVATGRNTDNVAKALGENDNLFIVKLDVTNGADAEAAMNGTVERFGRIDVLVSNAANFMAGFFEELTQEEIMQQLNTSLINPMIVIRAVLPVMRKQRSGHIIAISSTAGLTSLEFCSAYSASKFGLEGFIHALQTEVAPFGINTTIINPGFFRTELLTEQSTKYADNPIPDYTEKREQLMQFWKGANGQQSGDPAKLANALVTVAAEEKPPLRFLAGADAVATAEQVSSTLHEQANAYRELSSSMTFENT